MRKETNWYDYDEGYSIGTSGSDGGIIVCDEEHGFGARMTLEEEASSAPFSITCAIYGWMSHARFFTDEDEANREFEKMKIDLEKILSLIPAEEDADEGALDEISDEISEFVERFP
jgi:hypothetical protein